MPTSSIFAEAKISMFNKLKTKLINGLNKSKGIEWQDGERPGCTTLPNGIPYFLCNKTDSYDNAFPDIVRIAEAFAEVMPYAIDDKGKRLAKQPQIIRALYNPNEEMSGSDFLETLITMLLVHPLVHILVWHYENGVPQPGGQITPDNIAGFTFLEDAFMQKLDGKVTFRKGDKTWTRKDVITLSLNVNPYQVMGGYSPSVAIKKWATVDDYIAEYQAGQFANGGVPAGLMTVTAPSVDSYNEQVDKIIAAHTGPQNANRILYTHRPTSTIDGKPMAAGVEWTPFAQTNKELTLDSLFNQANKKIDMNFGVPEEVKGYLQNSNYASAEVADYVFSRRILYPKLVKVYSKLTHEINRITGGSGFAFGFDYELPVLTDTRKVQADTLIEMLDRGFSVESSVEALKLPRSFLRLTKTDGNQGENLQVEDTTKEKPSQEQTSKIAHDHNCEHCSHSAKSAENWEGVINPTLKGLIEFYLIYFFVEIKQQAVDTDVESVRQSINSVQKNVESDINAQKMRLVIISAIYYQLALNEIESSRKFANRLQLENPVSIMSDADLADFNLKVQGATAQIETLIGSGESLEPVATDSISSTVSKLTTALSAHNILAAIPDFAEGNNYEEQLNYLLVKFAKDNLDAWSSKITDATDSAETITIIAEAMSSNEYRVNRWALTEQHRGEELGKLLAAEEAGDVSELEPYKVWRIREGACPSCVALSGETVRADKEFSNGNMVPADHPNCRCYFDVEFRPLAKSVKVLCPNCKRYMFESNGGEMKNVICANSKCKKHYDFKICDGKIKAKERSI